MNRPKIILIAGPTASGKSALALDIARRMNGTIINADAMQIYAGLPILTAQPGPEEQKEIPHKLYAVLDPGERSSAGIWRRMALQAIEKSVAIGRVPVLVGGTGLYFRALLGGLADIPDISDEVRAKTQNLYEELGEEKFRGELAKRDLESASRIARNDRQRLIRAYEVFEHSGQALSEWQKNKPGADEFTYDTHLLLPEREILYAACDARFSKMIERGALDETQRFMERKLDPESPAMKTLGLRELAAHQRGEVSLQEAIARAQQVTRNYAKRQVTWFKNQKI
jgi:tRNA dimethylallyltransferase